MVLNLALNLYPTCSSKTGHKSESDEGFSNGGCNNGDDDEVSGDLTVDVPDGEGDFSSKLFLVKLHPDDLVREPLVEESVDLGAAAQLQGVDHRRAAALDRPLEVLLKLLDAPENWRETRMRVGEGEGGLSNSSSLLNYNSNEDYI